MRFSSALQIVLALGLVLTAGAAGQPAAFFLGRTVWAVKAPWFGGFSGIELSPDGRRMTVLSDRGTIVTADIRRGSTGLIDGISVRSAVPLRSSRNVRLTGRINDPEGLALAPDGSLFVSFEGVTRVARYRSPAAPAQLLPRPEAFRHFPENRALEPLAIDSRGRLYTLPEDAPDAAGNIPVFRWNGRAWSVPFSIPARDGFLPVGADFGPDGRFYLLERSIGIFGFRARVRRWDIEGGMARNETILAVTRPGRFDNLEGLSVWRDGAGRIRLTMISDDNFFFLQRTELVEYALVE